MSRGRRIALRVAGSLAGLLAVLFVAALVTVQTAWFRNLVRANIVSAVETGTGGKAEIGSFTFDWRHLRAEVRDFVLHGLEPADAPPLARARLLQVDLKLVSPFKRGVDIAWLLVDTPQVNVIVYPDGHTNVPAPKTNSQSNKNALETVVDLAIGRFELRNGSFTLAERRSDFNASGENLRAQLAYNSLHPSYTGEIDLNPLHLRYGTNPTVEVGIRLPVTLDKQRISLDNASLATLGGTFTFSGSLENLAAYRVAGRLSNFDIQQAAVAAALKLGYDGIVSGDVAAAGRLDDSAALAARARLAIAPGRFGVPLSGSLDAAYSARTGDVTLGRSFVALPNSRVDLSGTLGQQLDVTLVSRNLNDFRPVAAIPFDLNGGTAKVEAVVKGALAAPQIAGQLSVSCGAAGAATSRNGMVCPTSTSLTAAFTASPSAVSLSDGVLEHGALQAHFSAAVGMRNWDPAPDQPLRVDATIRNVDVRDILAVAGQSSVTATGALTADVHINGSVGDPRGNADLTIVNGTVQQERFDSLVAHVAMTDGSIDVPSLHLTAGASHIDATANYRHPRGALDQGTVRAHVSSNQLQLAQFQAQLKDHPGLSGVATLSADAAGEVVTDRSGSRFELATLTANASARNVQLEGKRAGDLTLVANSTGSTVQYTVNSNFAGAAIQVQGQSALAGDHRTTASATISNMAIDRVLAIAGQDLPLSGMLAATAQVTGTLDEPRATANIDVTKGSAYDQPFDRMQATIGYTSQSVDLSRFHVDAGPANLDVTGNFAHPRGDLNQGALHFHVHSNQIQLAKLQGVQQAKPGLGGTVELAADGAATIRPGAAPLLDALNANLRASGLTVDNKPVGNLTATAQTSGKEVQFQLNSDFARANIRGSGRMSTSGDYPVDARIDFSNVTYSGLSNWVGGAAQAFDASAEGRVTISGPLAKTEVLNATLQVDKLEAHAAPGAATPKQTAPFELHNTEPVVVSLDHQVVTIRGAHIAGPSTNLTISGNASLAAPQKLNLRTDGSIQLAVLKNFDSDIFASGGVALNAAVTGSLSQPLVNGRLQLQNASFNMLKLPNGLSNANGTVIFNGTEAVIQNITGVTGGGKVTLAGTVSYSGPETRFQVQVNADHVHVEYPPTISTLDSARVTLAGTSARSVLSGTVTIEDVAMHSHSDIGSMLTSASAPASSSSPTTGLLGGIRFFVRIQTAPGIQFHTTLTENLQGDANLTLRGTLDHPGMLGRVVITAGQVVFFGAKYDINQGTISFFDPDKVDPTLNVHLETTVQGVDVSLSVSGPIDRMKLAYSSDPPMEFSDLVSLLAAGKVSTTDPVLAARQPPPAQQSIVQSGASTLLGQAVASPVTGRLQRLFGVSSLRIDPQITGASNTTQATLTLQQQITREITFTYIQNVTQSNSQVIRVEWAINPMWSAVALRDYNGEFNLDFFYKKRFR